MTKPRAAIYIRVSTEEQTYEKRFRGPMTDENYYARFAKRFWAKFDKNGPVWGTAA